MSGLGMPMVCAFRENRQLILLAACFSVAAFLGCLFATLSCDGLNLEGYLTDHFTLAAVNGLALSPITVFGNCFRWPIFATLFSFTVLGALAIPALISLRVFLLSYTTACFGIVFGCDGLIISMVLFGATILLELPATFILYCELLRFCHDRVLKGGSVNRVILRPNVLLIGTGILILSFALQTTVIPRIFTVVCERIFL